MYRSLFHRVRRQLWSAKDLAINVLCQLGLIADPQTLRINNVSADFRVTTASERWRVHQAMGEKFILESIVSEIQQDDCFWDVGAAVGTYTCLALAAGAKVVAFEPHPTNYNRCTENIQLNEFEAEVYKKALSDSESIFTMSEDAGVGSGMHRLSSEGNLKVQTVVGDELDVLDPDIVKIDVEGHEMAVLRGMQDRLQTVRSVYVECHPELGVDPNEVAKFLLKFNYSINWPGTNRNDAEFLIASKKFNK